MNAKYSECSADLEPVVWVQGGTFGYIDKHSKLYQKSEVSPIAIMLLPLFRTSTEGTESLLYNIITTDGWVCGDRNKKRSEEDTNGQRSHVEE